MIPSFLGFSFPLDLFPDLRVSVRNYSENLAEEIFKTRPGQGPRWESCLMWFTRLLSRSILEWILGQDFVFQPSWGLPDFWAQNHPHQDSHGRKFEQVVANFVHSQPIAFEKGSGKLKTFLLLSTWKELKFISKAFYAIQLCLCIHCFQCFGILGRCESNAFQCS